MLRVCAAHDHRQPWILYSQPVQYLETVHLRHFKIQHQNIRMQLSDQLQALDTISRDPARASKSASTTRCASRQSHLQQEYEVAVSSRSPCLIQSSPCLTVKQ